MVGYGNSKNQIPMVQRVHHNVNQEYNININMRIRCGWEKFKDLLPLLIMKELSFHIKGNLYVSCVKSIRWW